MSDTTLIHRGAFGGPKKTVKTIDFTDPVWEEGGGKALWLRLILNSSYQIFADHHD